MTLPGHIDRLYFIGPTGAGKTTVGKRVARHFGLEFLDLDHAIEAHTGADVSLIFEIEGEEGFRRREAAMLKTLSERHQVCIATGAGAITWPDSQALLRSKGFVVYLATPVERQLKRLSRDRRRPLLQRPDREQVLEQMADDRNPLYEDLADLTVQSAACSVATMSSRVARQIEEQLRATLS